MLTCEVNDTPFLLLKNWLVQRVLGQPTERVPLIRMAWGFLHNLASEAWIILAWFVSPHILEIARNLVMRLTPIIGEACFRRAFPQL